MEKRVMVAGAGKSGTAAVKMMLGLNREVLLYDSNPDARTDISDSRLSVVFGELPPEELTDIEYCVISPGIDTGVPFVQMLKNAGIPVISEIQAAFDQEKGCLAAITGTNGKTTTTALTGAILQKKYRKTFTVGNIGIPYTQTCTESDGESVTVLETSSFQLETITDFHPHVSAILNITPDHLNRHHTMENYISVKESITKNQDPTDFCVLNYEDPELRRFGTGGECAAKTVFFSSETLLDNGYCLEGDCICRRIGGESQPVISVRDLNIIGKHNYENAMAAIAIASCMGVKDEQIREACTEFQAVEHRIEFVREVSGVRYYNDSKGTNPDAAIKAVLAMPGPICLIGGGYDKGSEYDEWVDTFRGRVKKLVLIGVTREKIAACCRKHGFRDYIFASTFEEAIKVCSAYADRGDCVLLSPACASWDMFPNYEERGRIFKEIVNRL